MHGVLWPSRGHVQSWVTHRRDLCIFGLWPNSSKRGEAEAVWEHRSEYWLVSFSSLSRAGSLLSKRTGCARSWSSSMCQVPLGMPGEALKSLQPVFCPAPGTVLLILLCSLVIELSQESILLKAALEKCQQRICCTSTNCSGSSQVYLGLMW